MVQNPAWRLPPSDYSQFVFGITQLNFLYRRLNSFVSQNLYDILGITTNATSNEIKRAYRNQALRWHPDKSPDATDEQRNKIVKRFKAIANAYDILSDDKKRQQYDKNCLENVDIPTETPSTMQYKDAVKIFMDFAVRILREDYSRNQSALKVISTFAISTYVGSRNNSFILGGAIYALLLGSSTTSVFDELIPEERADLIQALTIFVSHDM